MNESEFVEGTRYRAFEPVPPFAYPMGLGSLSALAADELYELERAEALRRHEFEIRHREMLLNRGRSKSAGTSLAQTSYMNPLRSAEDLLDSSLFNQSVNPDFFGQPPTRNNTVLSPPLDDTLEAFRYPLQKGVSPESSIGDDYLSSGGRLGYRSRTHLRTQPASQSGTRAFTSSTFLSNDVPELSPQPKDPNNLQTGDAWSFRTPGSAPSSLEPGSNVPLLMSPPALTIPHDTQESGFDPNASLFTANQLGLSPPWSLSELRSFGLIPYSPTSPGNQAKHQSQEALRHQVAQRSAESPLLSGLQSSDNRSGSRVQSPPAPDTQQTAWSTIVPQLRPMHPVPRPSLSDSNLFPHVGGPRPAIDPIPSGASNLGVCTTRARTHSNPPSSQWGAALPPTTHPDPTHGPGPATNTQLNLQDSSSTKILGNHASDLSVGVGGSLWDHAIDPMLYPINVASVHRARSAGDNRRGHSRNGGSEDVPSAFPNPEQSGQLYPASDGSFMLVPPSELGEDGRGHERLGSGTNFSVSRHKSQANFRCLVPGCGSTFAHYSDLRGHLRSHDVEKAFKCKWPACDDTFALAQECEQHEALHLNTQPIECRGCQQIFAPGGSLNAHLRSEDGIECRRVQNELCEGGVLTTFHNLEQHESLGRESGAGAPNMQGTKRYPEEEHEQNERQEREPKRGKIIHRDYADVIPNRIESASEIEHSTNGTTRDMEVDGNVSDTRSTITIQSGQITCEQMFQHLVAHGCADLSSDIDPGGYSSGLIQGGAFGDIWKGKLRDGTEVAIKVWRFSSLLHNGSKSMKRAMREIYYWSKAKHEYVQELMGVIMFQGRLGMVSLWMEHGNLREYICRNPNVDRYSLCYQVAGGIAYLHSREMVHGDLKGTNILVSRGGVAKLSDFDHSIMSECSIAFSETSKLGGGTTRWMAPELILDDDCNRSTCTDVYALGMTMLEIITGASPYTPQCKDDVNVIKAIMKKQQPARPMDRLSNNLRDNRMWELLLRCWDYDPLLRPKAAEVVETLQDISALSVVRDPA